MTISVVTASLPTRARLRAECRQSVQAQTQPVLEHLVFIDHFRRGESTVTNLLVQRAKGDCVITLNDDDLLLPNYTQVMSEHIMDADIIYSNYRVTGHDWYVDPSRCRPDQLEGGNFIPTTALIRKEWLERFPLHEDESHSEDWLFYRDCMRAGARFKYVDEVLWTYRFNTGDGHVNKSLGATPT